MSDDKLARWLHEATPEPPRPFVFHHPPDTRTGRTWLPVAAAACVAALVVALAAVLSGGGTRRAAAPAQSTGRSSTLATPQSSPATTVTRTSRGSAPATGSWGPRYLPAANLIPGSLVSDGEHVYALQRVGTIVAVVRFAPDGRVVARLQIADPQANTTLVIAAGRIWLLTPAPDNTARLLGLSATGLGVTDQITLPGGDVLAAHGRTLYVGDGDRVYVVDIASRTITDHYTFAGHTISALASNGHYLYVGTADNAPGPNLLLVTSDGAIRRIKTLNTVESLVVSSGGVWVISSGGVETTANFLSAAHPDRDTFRAEDGNPGPTVNVDSRTVWVGGISAMSCADPATGARRAGVPLGVGSTSRSGIGRDAVLGIARASGRVYGIATDFSNAPARLVSLHPPAACG